MERRFESFGRRPAQVCDVDLVQETVREVISKFETRDVYTIAEKSKVRIIYESWEPITVGEFDKKKRTICVNLRALESDKFSEQEIIAHELGHFFALELSLDRASEEKFAGEFAKALFKKINCERI